MKVYYICRSTFVYSAPVMQKSLSLSLVDVGIITSVFPSVYGVAKLFGGVLADVNSPRVVFLLGTEWHCLVHRVPRVCKKADIMVLSFRKRVLLGYPQRVAEYWRLSFADPCGVCCLDVRLEIWYALPCRCCRSKRCTVLFRHSRLAGTCWTRTRLSNHTAAHICARRCAVE
jgi:hypothetical protein